MNSKASRGWRAAWAIFAMATAAAAAPIRDIRVVPVGPVPINAEQVLAQVSARVGQEIDRSALSEDIRALQKSGAYSYAEARMEQAADGGIVLVFQVTGKPKIRQLSVTGADHVGNKKVRNLMEIGSGDRADAALLGQKAQKVRDHYRKEYYPDANLSFTFKTVPDYPEFADVEIVVAEGKPAVVRKIRFKGNRHVSAHDLRKVMQQRQANWLSFFTSAGMYEPGSLTSDRETIRKVFMDKGYLGAGVGEPEIAYVGRKKIDVTFQVSEGPVYKMGAWRLGGVTLFPTGEVARGVSVPAGAIASLAGIDKSAQNVRDFFGSRGYIKTEVVPRVTLDTNAATAAVSYQVKEGSLAYIQNVEIRGNAQTKDKVVRREIGVAPGEIYNEVKVRSSEKRLRNLNYFSFVNAYPENTAVSNRFNLVFDLEEQRTGQFMVGVGISSVDDIIGYVELTQGNFDLFGWPHLTGGGQKLRLRAQVGSSRSDLELSLIEPWFLNRRLSLGLDLFRRDARYLSDEYDQLTTGGSLTLGKPLRTFNRINWIYGLENIDINNVSTNASDLILAEEGGRLKSYGTLEVVRDTRDSTFIATRGFRGSVSATLAGGPFGGDSDTYQFQLRAAEYVPLWFDNVISLRGWASMIEEYGDSDRVPIFDRLFAGGPRTVRAFKYRKVGPKDEDHEAIGGRSAATLTAEYTIPVWEKIRFAFFYDAGIVWQDLFDKDTDPENAAVGDGVFCDGYGLGVRFDFPGFPIQLDYAWPLNTDEYLGDSGRFSFSIGYTY